MSLLADTSMLKVAGEQTGDAFALREALVPARSAGHRPTGICAVEEGIAADAGRYFREPGRFARMVVFASDDRDRPQPERYATLAAAPKQREQVVEAVIVRRPSMVPDRHARP